MMRTLLPLSLSLVSACASAPTRDANSTTRWNGREGASSGSMSHLEEPTGASVAVTPLAITVGRTGATLGMPLPAHGTLAEGVVESSTPIAVGQTITGQLQRGDLQVADGALADDYVFVGEAGESIVAELHGAVAPAEHMDMYLYLLLDGREITHDDDGAGNLDSRITVTLPSAGVYTLRATTFGGTMREGAYTLSLQRADPG